MEIKEKLYPDDHYEKAATIMNIGTTFTKKKDYKAALQWVTRSYEMIKRLLPEKHPDITTSLRNLAFIYEAQEDYNSALEYYKKRYGMAQKVYSNDHPKLNDSLSAIASIYKKKDDIEDGLAFCRNQLDVQKALLGQIHPRIAYTLMTIGDLTRDPKEALKYYQQALNVLDCCNSSDDKAKIKCLRSISDSNFRQELYEDTLKFRSDIFELQSQTLSSDHIDIAESLYWLGSINFKLKHDELSISYLEQSLKIYNANYSSNHEMIREVQDLIKQVKEELDGK